jgi:disulfide oxidoreductase YuzD
MDALFQCNSCKEQFHNEGLHLVIHNVALVHICPSCLSHVKTFQVQMKRDSPGKPFEYEYFNVLNKFDHEDKHEPPQT